VTTSEPGPAPADPAQTPLPPGLDLLWGRRERGKRGPRPGLSPEAIVEAGIKVADADGLEAVSMARVAKELGFTTMSLYRHVASKDELLQLMWDASATGAETLVLEGDTWRQKLTMWTTLQWDTLRQHPWITQMPMAAPPMAPNSVHFVERGLAAFDGLSLRESDKLRIIGLISTYTLGEGRMANDAARAIKQATAAGQTVDPAAMPSYESILRGLVDEKTFPHVYRTIWSDTTGESATADEEFLIGLNVILDGVQALIDRTSAAGPAG
jgi:AcrR family transcriptional regulator